MRELLEPIWPFYSAIRTIVIVLEIILLFVGIYAASEVYKYRMKFVMDPRRPPKKRKHSPQRFPGILDEWKKIETRLASGSPDSTRLAIIEADGLVDQVLKKLHLEGETFADRLARLSSREIPSVDGVWAAHRVRNDLVHTPGFGISADKAKELFKLYETFLRDMKVFPLTPIERVEEHARPMVIPPD